MVAWDASTDRGGDPDNVVPVTATLDQTASAGDVEKHDLRLSTPAGFLDDPSTQYPVTIDPDINAVSGGKSTWMRKDTPASTSNQAGQYHRLLIGRVPGADNPNHAMSYLAWSNAQLAGKTIIKAELNVYQYDAGACAPRTLMAHPLTGAFTVNTEYENRPDVNINTGDSTSLTTNPGSDNAGCTSANAWVRMNVTEMAKAWAAGTYTNYGVRLNVPSDSLSDATYSRRLCSSKPDSSAGTCSTASTIPSLKVTWAAVPTTPVLSSAQPLNAEGDRPVVESDSPQLSARSTDADTSRLTLSFEIWNRARSSRIQAGTAGVNSGTNGLWSASVLANGLYSYRVRAFDGLTYSAWSGWSDFEIELWVDDPQPKTDDPTVVDPPDNPSEPTADADAEPEMATAADQAADVVQAWVDANPSDDVGDALVDYTTEKITQSWVGPTPADLQAELNQAGVASDVAFKPVTVGQDEFDRSASELLDRVEASDPSVNAKTVVSDDESRLLLEVNQGETVVPTAAGGTFTAVGGPLSAATSTEVNAVAQTLTDDTGIPVTVSESTDTQSQLTGSRANDNPTFYGGALIRRDNYRCSLGIGLRVGKKTTGITTADHCGKATWKSPDNKRTVGTTRIRRKNVDTQLIRQSATSLMWRGKWNAKGDSTAQVVGRLNLGGKGSRVCIGGGVSGQRCKTVRVVSRNTHIRIFVDGKRVKVGPVRVIRGDIPAGGGKKLAIVREGDSGGPVYSYNKKDDPNQVVIRGFVVGIPLQDKYFDNVKCGGNPDVPTLPKYDCAIGAYIMNQRQALKALGARLP